jgi:hypothetical protein
MADERLVERLNSAIAANSLAFANGERVRGRLDGGLVRGDGTLLYPIVRGIPLLTADQAIRLPLADRLG